MLCSTMKYSARLMPGGITCLTLLLQRWLSSRVANNVASYGNPWHDEKHKHKRGHIRQVALDR